MPHGFRKRVPAGCVLHFASLAEEEIEPRPGYSVTTPLRTLIDVAGSALNQEHLDVAVKEAMERGLVRRSVLGSVRCEAAARMRLDRALASLTIASALAVPASSFWRQRNPPLPCGPTLAPPISCAVTNINSIVYRWSYDRINY